MAAWVPIVTAFVAALTASVGYFLTNRAKQIDERRTTYAAALLAVQTYKALPYRIRRRADSTPETRNSLGATISDAERDLDYYRMLFDLDNEDVADRFQGLVQKVRRVGTDRRAEAWNSGPITDDPSMRFTDNYEYDDRYQIDMCMIAMRTNLKLLSLK